MKRIFFYFVVALLSVSCKAQQLVQKPMDAKKLEIRKADFIQKPFSYLLKQIKPDIIYVYGSPNNIYGGSLKFFFESKSLFKNKM